jgi:hypothetical protein
LFATHQFSCARPASTIGARSVLCGLHLITHAPSVWSVIARAVTLVILMTNYATASLPCAAETTRLLAVSPFPFLTASIHWSVVATAAKLDW